MTEEIPADLDVAALIRQNRMLREQLDEANGQIEGLRNGIEALHDVGIYNYRHPLENAVAYERELEIIAAEVKAQVSDGRAIEVSTRFTFDNSLAKVAG